MSFRTSIIRTIDCVPAHCLITLTLDDGITAHLTYRQAAQLPYWLKPDHTKGNNDYRCGTVSQTPLDFTPSRMV